MSVIAYSYASYLAMFKTDKVRQLYQNNYIHDFNPEIAANELFQANCLSWDKRYPKHTINTWTVLERFALKAVDNAHIDEEFDEYLNCPTYYNLWFLLRRIDYQIEQDTPILLQQLLTNAALAMHDESKQLHNRLRTILNSLENKQ